LEQPSKSKEKTNIQEQNGNEMNEVTLDGQEKTVTEQVSPIARFRKYRPLAVSDFVAPAWCELQYFYSLSKYGRIRRTAAMKKGTEVHKTLELEVHEYVPVQVLTKEDSWGLRIWNVIQGLRALRATGVTRELDVWGVVNGEVVSGIIDEISTTCPDPELEAAVIASGETISPSPQQRTITEFFGDRTADARNKTPTAKYYISDTKTRNSPTLPNDASLRQVRIQLMLYHHMISLLSSAKVQSEMIFRRYNLDPVASFSETFLGELANLETEINHNFGVDESGTGDEDHFAPNNLGTLWEVMIVEFQNTFDIYSLMPILSASFKYQADGSHLGVKSFVHDEAHLDKYIGHVLKWWKGERPANGVDIEDAFKCRICEFAEGCEWRKEKEDEIKARRWKRGLPKPSY
jgi:exonuclease V